MTAHFRALAFVPTLLLLDQPAAPPRFEARQPQLFAAGGTLVNAAADYDGDGDVDLFVGFNGAPNRLYRCQRAVPQRPSTLHRRRGRGKPKEATASGSGASR